MLNERFDELKHGGKLPSPSGVGLRILQLTKSEDYSVAELTSVIQTDPALTGRVIKVANSPQYGTAEPVCTVEAAAVRLAAPGHTLQPRPQ